MATTVPLLIHVRHGKAGSILLHAKRSTGQTVAFSAGVEDVAAVDQA